MLLHRRDRVALAFENDQERQFRTVFKRFCMLRAPLQFQAFYAPPSDFCVSEFHRCAFDHEREYRKRVRNQMAMDIIREHVILGPRDVVEMVKRDIDWTARAKRSRFINSFRDNFRFTARGLPNHFKTFHSRPSLRRHRLLWRLWR